MSCTSLSITSLNKDVCPGRRLNRMVGAVALQQEGLRLDMGNCPSGVHWACTPIASTDLFPRYPGFLAQTNTHAFGLIGNSK